MSDPKKDKPSDEELLRQLDEAMRREEPKPKAPEK